mgnify:CR=1 FL=1
MHAKGEFVNVLKKAIWLPWYTTFDVPSAFTALLACAGASHQSPNHFLKSSVSV